MKISKNIWLILLALSCLLLIVFAISIGSTTLSPIRVFWALVGEGSRSDSIIINQLRAPRIFLGLVAGGSLALAGLLLQWLTRNPLSSPSALGLVDGAALGAIGFLYLFTNESNALTVSVLWQPLAATLGAAAMAVFLMLMLRGQSMTPIRLILLGAVMAAGLKGIINLLIIAGPVYQASNAMIWIAGSLHHARWIDVQIIAPALLMVVGFLYSFRLTLLQCLLDDQTSQTTGLALERTRHLLLILAVVLIALSVSSAGALGFVGLIAPHIAQRIFGYRVQLLIPGCLLIGGTITVVADIFARVLFSPLEIPTGTVTAFIGAPYFLFLLWSTKVNQHA
ncbi:FecCD family ABC transporter permease [Reinekea sp.]|jgi:iron complex transport system permease protein|uniref:FecCD family ABC transporter permease n=1 Tax=Reinekea sp. TaxID=1970455 RepID=UPI003989C9F7